MGRDYFYFAASLPLLSREGKTPLSVEQFLSDAGRLLPPKDSALIQVLLADTDGKYFLDTEIPVVCAWTEFDRTLRNETAWFRAQRAHKDPGGNLRGARGLEPRWQETVREASRESNPLSAEKILDSSRWQFLEELAVGHYFDLEFLVIYAVKLKIVRRYQAIHSGRGGEIFKEYQGMEMRV